MSTSPHAIDPNDVALASGMAGFYRARGWNPLPSRMDEKRPMIRYARYWGEPAPASLFDEFPTTNVQLVCGRRWGLLVIDLDGYEAREWFYSLGEIVPATWITHSGGNGWHLWFRIGPRFQDPLPKAFLWRGDEGHSGVERLCDGSLIMAPPSIHPRTKERYRFIDAKHSPKRLPMPAWIPAWVLGLKPIEMPRPEYVEPTRERKVVTHGSVRYQSRDVLEAIPDYEKVSLARSWGLRLASDRPNASGWCPCHAIGREDRNPSGSFSPSSGWYMDFTMGEKLGFFELGVRLGVYLTWQDAVADLGERFGVGGNH